MKKRSTLSQTESELGSFETGKPFMQGRIQSIDAFRGFAIIVMAVGNFAAPVAWVPAALKHMPDIGLTIADLIAPMFIFAIAFTIGPSYQRKKASLGGAPAVVTMIRRSLSLIGIGAILTAGEALLPSRGILLSWGVLQCLGLSTLILLTVISRPYWVRLISGICLFTVYQILLDRFFLQNVITTSHNGLFGALSWAAMLMFATVVADQFHLMDNFNKRTGLLLTSGLLSAGLGALLSLWIPISKHRASPSFMLVSLGFCLVLFALFHLIFDARSGRLEWLQRVGRNPMAMYLAHLLLLGVIVLPGQAAWYTEAPIWLSLLQAGAIFAAMVGIAALFEKRSWIIHL